MAVMIFKKRLNAWQNMIFDFLFFAGPSIKIMSRRRRKNTYHVEYVCDTVDEL